MGLRGALRCAQVHDGEVPDHAVPVEGRVFEPDAASRAAYNRLFEQFRVAHEALGGVYRALDPLAPK